MVGVIGKETTTMIRCTKIEIIGETDHRWNDREKTEKKKNGYLINTKRTWRREREGEQLLKDCLYSRVISPASDINRSTVLVTTGVGLAGS